MTNIFTIFARQNQSADKTVVEILKTISNNDREKDRGSYYKSLSGLLRHVAGGTLHLLTMFRDTVSGNSAALKALDAVSGVKLPDGVLTEAQWEEITAAIAAIDQAYVDFTRALGENELNAEGKWFTGDMVPLHYMLEALAIHGSHHRGQISQILDEMKIVNDYSGINPAFLK
jgi:uncharacterized damage-inducible protein DinB